jgi:hypothetical protein
VVNDFGGDVHGAGGSSEPAQRVVEEIVSAGGEALSHGADVANLTRRKFCQRHARRFPQSARRSPVRLGCLQPRRVAARRTGVRIFDDCSA